MCEAVGWRLLQIEEQAVCLFPQFFLLLIVEHNLVVGPGLGVDHESHLWCPNLCLQEVEQCREFLAAVPGLVFPAHSRQHDRFALDGRGAVGGVGTHWARQPVEEILHNSRIAVVVFGREDPKCVAVQNVLSHPCYGLGSGELDILIDERHVGIAEPFHFGFALKQGFHIACHLLVE